MEIVIDIPEEQIKKSLEESKYIHEDEGEKGFVNIILLYTNGQLEFVAVERKTDFYSCKYKILPKGHGRLIDADELYGDFIDGTEGYDCQTWNRIEIGDIIEDAQTIIEADKEEEQ